MRAPVSGHNRHTDLPPKTFVDLFVTNHQICRLKEWTMWEERVSHTPSFEPALTLHFPPPARAVYRIAADYLHAIKHLSPDNRRRRPAA